MMSEDDRVPQWAKNLARVWEAENNYWKNNPSQRPKNMHNQRVAELLRLMEKHGRK